MQLSFEFKNYEFQDDVPIDKLTISPMNLRAMVNDEAHIKNIAEKINDEGFSPIRGLLVNSRNGDYRVIAGSNRLRAMQYLGRKSVPIYLFKELTDEQEARLSEQDNRQDETHKPTHFLEKAEAFNRIIKEKDWTQGKIAQEYDTSQGEVSRLYTIWVNLSDTAKKLIKGNYSTKIETRNNWLYEAWNKNYSTWNNFFDVRSIYAIAKNLRKAQQVKIVLEIIKSSGKLKGQKLKDECEKYNYQEKLKCLVLEYLYEKKLSDLRDIFRDIEKGVYGDGKGEKGAFEDGALGKRIAALNEQAKCRFVCGDATDPAIWEDVNDKSIAVVITDPPYGIGYLTNYRIIKNDDIAQPIENDDDMENAKQTFAQMLENLNPKMQDDSHLYVFSSWKVYPEFVEMINKYFIIKNVIVWDKQNWSAGDLEGNYAEQYEIVIFATKGNRKLCGEKRLTNLMSFPRVAGNEQIVSAQKPVELIKTLLCQSASEGELICDPFAGSGTLMLACDKRNPYFCLEKDPLIYKKAQRRIQENVRG